MDLEIDQLTKKFKELKKQRDGEYDNYWIEKDALKAKWQRKSEQFNNEITSFEEKREQLIDTYDKIQDDIAKEKLLHKEQKKDEEIDQQLRQNWSNQQINDFLYKLFSEERYMDFEQFVELYDQRGIKIDYDRFKSQRAPRVENVLDKIRKRYPQSAMV